MSGFNNRPPVAQSILDNAIGGNISGIFSTAQIAKYASGARCILKINGKLVGFAFAISWRINTMFAEINTIDDTLPAELVPQRISVDGTISALHIPGQNATTELWQADVLSFLFLQYLSIEVRDSQTDQLLFYTDKAAITTRQEELRIDSLASVTLSFKAIGWKDEKPPEMPQNYNVKSSDQSGDAGLAGGIVSRLVNPIFGAPTSPSAPSLGIGKL